MNEVLNDRFFYLQTLNQWKKCNTHHPDFGFLNWLNFSRNFVQIEMQDYNIYILLLFCFFCVCWVTFQMAIAYCAIRCLTFRLTDPDNQLSFITHFSIGNLCFSGIYKHISVFKRYTINDTLIMCSPILITNIVKSGHIHMYIDLNSYYYYYKPY